MNEIIKKAKEQLQNGDLKSIAEKSGISYQVICKVLQGGKSTRQNEIIKAVADFLQERKNELQNLELLLN
jgi:predicted transcriptional regulator